MSEELLINIKERKIVLNIDDYLIFTGGNNHLHNEILNSLRTLDKKSSLWSQLDENFDSRQIRLGNRKVTKKDTNLIHIQSVSDLLMQLEVKKGTLMYNYLVSKIDHNSVSDIMDEINESIMVLENIINRISFSFSEKIELNIIELTFDKILQKMTDFSINYFNQIGDDLSSVLKTFLLLLDHNATLGEKYFIIVNGLNRYFSEEQYKLFLQNILMLSVEYNRIKIFVFHNSIINIDLGLPLEKFVLIYNDVQQLPPLEYLYESISRNYPDQLKLTEEEVNIRISRLLPYIGKKLGSYIPLNDEYMLLLIVLKDLLDDWEPVETSQRTLSKLEQRFLADQKPKVSS